MVQRISLAILQLEKANRILECTDEDDNFYFLSLLEKKKKKKLEKGIIKMHSTLTMDSRCIYGTFSSLSSVLKILLPRCIQGVSFAFLSSFSSMLQDFLYRSMLRSNSLNILDKEILRSSILPSVKRENSCTFQLYCKNFPQVLSFQKLRKTSYT